MRKAVATFTASAAAMSVLSIFGIADTASAGLSSATAKPAGTAISPQSCQGPSAVLKLGTDRKEYKYNCTGYQYDSAGAMAYYILPGGWSGFVRADSGFAYKFCDFQEQRLPNPIVSYVYLSPTKESWCK
jgi:hypothetical protein